MNFWSLFLLIFAALVIGFALGIFVMVWECAVRYGSRVEMDEHLRRTGYAHAPRGGSHE